VFPRYFRDQKTVSLTAHRKQENFSIALAKSYFLTQKQLYMKYSILQNLKKMVLFTTAILYSLVIYAQREVPQMWVSKHYSKARVKMFSKGNYPSGAPSKEAVLSKAVGGTHPLHYSYPAECFDKLIDLMQIDNSNNKGTGFRVYFGAYTGTTLPNQLVLIFTASKGLHSPDFGNYYIFGPSDGMPQTIPATIAGGWIANYINTEDNPDGLVKTLEPGQPENKVPGLSTSPSVYSDTRSIYYDSQNFVDFIQNERAYQDSNRISNPSKIKIESIEIDFAAYQRKGIGANPHGIKRQQFKDRLILQFEFVRNGKIFYIDDAKRFRKRHKPYSFFENSNMKMLGGNNGQLCPPNCPCPPSCGGN
jgi:hypothetical protein